MSNQQVEDRDDSSPIARLYKLTSGILVVLARHSSESIHDNKTSELASLVTTSERLILWGDGFDAAGGKLDKDLQRSHSLRTQVESILQSIAENLVYRCASYMPANDAAYEEVKALFQLLERDENEDSLLGRESDAASHSNQNRESTDTMLGDLGEIVEDLWTDVNCLENLSPALESPAQGDDLDRAASPIRQYSDSATAKAPKGIDLNQAHRTGKMESERADLRSHKNAQEKGEKEVVRKKLRELIMFEQEGTGIVTSLGLSTGFSKRQVIGALMDLTKEDGEALDAESGNQTKGDETSQSRPKVHVLSPARPTYPKIHRDDVSIDTLIYYNLPWEYDRSDPSYIVILRELDHHETDVLFEHTRRWRLRGFAR
ncbi:MAG: hypothetical protein M1822_002326 [Bathelium mastoideum]|nr:MAG: hypothetical protein M1822_002326 [Bathelium mastoideum]